MAGDAFIFHCDNTVVQWTHPHPKHTHTHTNTNAYCIALHSCGANHLLLPGQSTLTHTTRQNVSRNPLHRRQ